MRPGAFVKLEHRGDVIKGCAVWQRDGVMAFGCASANVDWARELVLRACRAAAERLGPGRKAKAQKVLSALLAQNLRVGARDDPDLEEDLEVLGEALELAHDRVEVGRRRRGRRARKFGRRVKRAIHRVARRVAKNRVMQRLRKAYAKALSGPLGDAAAKGVAAVLQAYGVPRRATQLAIQAHHARIADRMRKGGWAGEIERVTEKRTLREGLRSLAKEEAKRHGRALREAARKQLPGFLRTSGVGEGEDLAFEALRRARGLGLPGEGIGFGGLYAVGACL